MTKWRTSTSILLAAAAIGAIVHGANASVVGRVAGVFSAFVLVVVGIGVWRAQTWAFGSAMLLGICWFWAVVALTLQGSLPAVELVVWLVWSVAVIVGSVRGRERVA